MKQPMILVSAGYQLAQNGIRQRYLYQNYADAISNAGGYPILPLDSGKRAAQNAALCDGLLLTGGPDVDPILFHQEKSPLCGRIDAERDAEEWALLEAFLKAGKPVFGICRGIQIINTFFGGTLHQDIPSKFGVNHGDGAVHSLLCEEGSLAYRFFGRESTCNSYHHQSIDQVADGFWVTARSGDCNEIIEAMEHRTLPISAVQYHPERMTGAEKFAGQGPDTAALFSHFIGLCTEDR